MFGGNKSPRFEAYTAGKRWDQFLRDFGCRAIAIPRILCQTALRNSIRILSKQKCEGCGAYSKPVKPRKNSRKPSPLPKCTSCGATFNERKPAFTHFRVHDLRHFCASLLLAQGVQLKVISELLGHSQISITGDIYAHVMPALKTQTADVMNGILSQKSDSQTDSQGRGR